MKQPHKSEDLSNINDLRAHALETLKKLEKGKIDVEEAGVTGKLYESVMSSLKLELEYHKMLGQQAKIHFLEGDHKIVNNVRLLKQSKLITSKEDK